MEAGQAALLCPLHTVLISSSDYNPCAATHLQGLLLVHIHSSNSTLIPTKPFQRSRGSFFQPKSQT